MITGTEFNDKLNLNKLVISLTHKFKGLLKISSFSFTTVSIGGENYNGNIILNTVWANTFSIKNLANYYIENPKDKYSKPLKCGYDPYTNTWEEWSKNPLKEKAINYYHLKN